MTVVLDASAVLAFIAGEPGAELVEGAMTGDARCGAANWSEVAQKVRQSGRDWTLVVSLLNSYNLTVEPVTAADGERAAERWTSRSELSLGDRLCLALADRLNADALTADSAWGKASPVRQIR